MKYKNQALIPGTITICILFLFISCKKLNEATTLGGDLIPAVDNVTTFETTLDVDVFNDTFGLAAPNYDSLRVKGSDTHFFGNITNDPLFGTSTGTIFTQLKPPFFRYAFSFAKPDSLVGLDSVVLVLKYVNTYGDTITPQSVNVFEVDPSNDFRYDTSYLMRENQITYSNLLGTGNFSPQFLDDSVHLFKDSSSHQLRIRLNDAFGQRLLAYDSSSVPGNNAYYSDSAFNLLFKGFAIVTGGSSNAMIGIDLTASKLSIYYKYKHGVLDTAIRDFGFTSTSASSNYVQRDYSGSQLNTYLGASVPQDFGFIQTQPGTFARIKIHGLDTLSNRVIHRAELIVTQAYNDIWDDILVPPTYLYVDANDSANSFYRSIPFDVAPPDPSSVSVVTSNPLFGFSGKPAIDGANTIQQWKFDLSRYVQNVVKGGVKPYDLRLYAPYISRNTFYVSGTDYSTAFFVNPAIVAGRVRIYGGTPVTNPNRMRLRIIYSKI